MSAPSSSRRRRSVPEERPLLWVNPCGIYEYQSPLDHEHADVPQQTVSEMLNAIILSAGNALGSVEGFKHDFVRETFKLDFLQHHNGWKEQGYEWLPKIPKSLGIKPDPEHLQNIVLNDFLKKAYKYLQTMAVALEQVVWDGEQNESNLVGKFKDIEFKLKAVLCEVQMAMFERNVEQFPDVSRDVMPDDIRNLEDTFRKLRDWFIFRDYMTVLEYIKEVCEYFIKDTSLITPS